MFMWMIEPTRLEFDMLDSEGLECHRWVSDVEKLLLMEMTTLHHQTLHQ